MSEEERKLLEQNIIYEDTIVELQEKNKKLITDYRMSIEKRVELEQKIDKAIEYMERLEILNGYWGYLNFTNGDRNNVLKILGSDKE